MHALPRVLRRQPTPVIKELHWPERGFLSPAQHQAHPLSIGQTVNKHKMSQGNILHSSDNLDEILTQASLDAL